MKMGPGLFWGIILILIGLSIIFKIVFGISIFRVIIATALILLGVKILIGGHMTVKYKGSGNDVIFGEHVYTTPPKNNAEYNTVFASAVHDFSKLELDDNKPVKIKVNTVFGRTIIKVNNALPLKIKADAAFAGARMPDGNSVVFGTTHYSSDSFPNSKSYLYIESSTVFGSLDVVEK